MNEKMAKRMRAVARALVGSTPKMTAETSYVVLRKNPTTVRLHPLCMRAMYQSMKRYYAKGATK